jgi:lipopolysaccharide export system protein LptA
MTPHMIRRLALLALPAALFAAAPLHGQGSVSALRGHDTAAPLDIEADRIEVQDRLDRALFTGNVRVRQGSMAIDAQRLRVAYVKRGNSGDLEIQRVDADGSVTMRSPSETARGNAGVYDVQNRLLTLIGNVRLERGQSVLNGQRLVINLDDGRSTLDGGAVQGQSGGRVTGRFVVPQRSN